ncbi:DNA cytosine methyltransferase [Chryseobacterium sp.]|uniref:DNA cytosine methyltransferase n=1 Tax=Chryseobacterium sp. TaxID=1871047 RepID=UPI003218F239
MKIATVCSGIGSPEQALKELGIPHEIYFACEIDKYAKKSYLENFTPKIMLSDMTKESWIGKEYYSDLFIGGIPCQSFSLAGKRLGELDPRGLLFYDYYRYIKKQQPKYFIIENVKGLLSDNDGNTFQNWINLLGQSVNGTPFFFPHEDSLLYNLHWEVLNTKDYELPQNRERVFLVGIRNELPNDFVFPGKKPLKLRLKDILEKHVNKKYYLSKKMIDGFISHSERHREKGNGFKFETKDTNSIANTITTTEGSRGYNNFIKEGYINQNTQASQVFSEFGISPTLASGTHGYANGYVKIGAVRGRNPEKPKSRKSGLETEQMLEINENGVSNCLSTVQKDNLVIEYGYETLIRRLTPLECFRLQGYPDSFFYNCESVNSDTQLYKQVGNTISVTVIKAILKNLLKNETTY